MEKFGIFELLDALSALTAAEGSGKPAETEPPAETRRPDGAFAPPAYGEGTGGEGTGPAPVRHDPGALSDFLARHDAVARKADGKK